ncbi:MAG: DUF697 domain-containing protein [Fimbriimonadaceae bacterium]|nr:DUF697 domain-containing protein [Fimbriimonadaceae bacterium]
MNPTLPETALEDVRRELARDIGRLRELLNSSSGLTAAQKQEFESEFGQLDELLERLEQGYIYLAVFGKGSVGKSSLVNSILGLPADHPDAAPMHPVIGTTAHEFEYRWGGKWVLCDTPGTLSNADHERVALEAASRAHGHLFVITDEPVREEARLFDTVVERFPNSPRLVFVNKTDTWPHRYTLEEQMALRRHLRGVCQRWVRTPEDIVFGHASHIEAGVRLLDRVPELIERIYAQTNELGELAALLDPAGLAVGVGSRIRERLREVRRRVAEGYLKPFAGVAAATGLIPAPGVDVAAFALSQVGMIVTLASCFDLKLTRREASQVALTIARSIGTTLGGWAIYVGGVMVVDSLLNLIPGVGGWLSNLLMGTARTAGVGYWTYLMGRVAIEFFAAEMRWDGEQMTGAIRRIHEELAAEWFGKQGQPPAGPPRRPRRPDRR